MGIVFKRQFLQADELLQRWKCSERDLKYEVIEGQLRPIIFVSDPEKFTDLENRPTFGPDEHYHNPADDDDVLGPTFVNRGYLVLRHPIRDGIDSCYFPSFSRHDEPSPHIASIEFGIPLEKYWSELLFDLPSILRFEAERTEGMTSKQLDEKSLSTRERDTLLKLVIGMAVKGYNYDSAAAKSRAPKEIADDLADLGIGVSDDTVRKYLKQATDTVLPTKPHQP
ncbi:hypothetical protein [Rhodoferax sediminis]|uniref:Uncharacterized protein n=1 Tax=Rhodoferax sediminis TaxID=2509614 RepID=A0A515DG32_9BURK|nr:hypothetical protein [Rhodoferax sediminis]QDL39337.1 hypothetical protein EUB48_19950 [Rhodoferax sediminis]